MRKVLVASHGHAATLPTNTSIFIDMTGADEMFEIINDALFKMTWLNQLIGAGLTGIGVDTTSQVGASVLFFCYDTVKIAILLVAVIFIIGYIQSYFPPERTKRLLGHLHGVSPENFKNDVVRAINDADAGDGVLLLADLFGGTPSNSVAQVLGTCHMRAIAGANLPMLLTALLDRGDAELDELADTAMHAGQTGVVDIGEKVFGAVVQDDDQDF